MDKSGFTLIEMSIVLVIIGLIVGGILTGQDLIAGAQLRAQISQLARFDSAVNAFRNKYGCLPGDCVNADDFLPLTDTTWEGNPLRGVFSLNGNGNGFIDTMTPSYNWYAGGLGGYYPEPSQLFASLWVAGLISDSYNPGADAPYAATGSCGNVLFPVSPLSGRVGVYTNTITTTSTYDPRFTSTADYHSYWLVGVGIRFEDCSTVTNETEVDTPAYITPLMAYQLDQKIDDGLPLTGSVRITTYDGAWENMLFDGVPGVNCVNLNSEYAVNSTATLDCAVRVRTAW